MALEQLAKIPFKFNIVAVARFRASSVHDALAQGSERPHPAGPAQNIGTGPPLLCSA
jgi:hypothetical protein